MQPEKRSDQTQLTHDARHDKGAVSPPIYQSSLFSFSDYDSMIARFRGDSDQPLYSRVDNPTVKELQEKVAKLEQGGSLPGIQQRHGGDQQRHSQRGIAR